LQSIGNIFDEYRGTFHSTLQCIKDTDIFYLVNDNPNTIGIDGAMKYFKDINVQLDEVTCLGIMELCKCPAMGEFTREEFITGWRSVQSVTPPLQTPQTNRRTSLPTYLNPNSNPNTLRKKSQKNGLY
jgi:hypothetical protein